MTDHTTQDEGNRKEAAATTGTTLLRILDGQRAHGRMLQSILELLTAAREGDGPSLTVLLENLIKRIGDQTSAIQALTLSVAKLGRELPANLVAAIEDNLGSPEQFVNNDRDGSVPS